jgi:hypothetical protein
VDALEALGADDFHVEKTGALGGPITAGADPVFLAGEDDQGNPVGFVGRASLVDECWFALLGLDLLVWRGELPFRRNRGLYPPLTPGIIRGHAVLKEEFSGRTGLLDGTRRADVIGDDGIAKDAKRARALISPIWPASMPKPVKNGGFWM